MAKKGVTNNPNGRDVIPIDWKTVISLCKIQCTGEEIAAVLDISYDTLEKAIRREQKLCFTDFYKRHSAHGKASLRRAQYQLAVEKHNPTMLIWLGKQQLGQKEPDREGADVAQTAEKFVDAFTDLIDKLPD